MAEISIQNLLNAPHMTVYSLLFDLFLINLVVTVRNSIGENKDSKKLMIINNGGLILEFGKDIGIDPVHTLSEGLFTQPCFLEKNRIKQQKPVQQLGRIKMNDSDSPGT
jgi:hypothetical protein